MQWCSYTRAHTGPGCGEFLRALVNHLRSAYLNPVAQPGMGESSRARPKPLRNHAYLKRLTIVLAFKQLYTQQLPVLHGPVPCCVSNQHNLMLSCEIKNNPMCAHKIAMHATKRRRLTLDSYFERASGSGSEVLTQMCMGDYIHVIYENESANSLRTSSLLPHPPPWRARPLFKFQLCHRKYVT